MVRRRLNLDRDLHGQMIRGAAVPAALQGNSIARVLDDGDADEVLVADNAGRRIEIDPARTGYVNLNPGVGIAAGYLILIVVIIVIIRVGQVHVAGNKPRGDAPPAQGRDHQRRQIATRTAAESQRAERILNSLFHGVPRA